MVGFSTEMICRSTRLSTPAVITRANSSQRRAALISETVMTPSQLCGQSERRVIDPGQHMPREQISFGCMRVTGQDERIDALRAVGIQFCQHLVRIANDCSPA